MIRNLWRAGHVLGVISGLLLMAACGGGGGGGSTPSTPSTNPVPAITSLSPTSTTLGATSQTLTITGSSFLSTSSATYNAVSHAVTFVSATQLTISLSTGDLAAAGTYSVVVTNPTPGGGTSNAANFAVNNPAPSISSLSPSTATAGATSQSLTINGSNFLSSSTASYNGAPHTVTSASETQLTITLSTGDLATAGSYPVVVTNPTPGGGASNSATFTVNAPAVSVTIPSGNYSTSMTVGASQTITAVVTGATPNLNWTISGSNGGTISGTGTSVTYKAPSAIPGGNNPVTITASQANTSASASVEVTINPSSASPNAINIPGSQDSAAGINLSIPSSSPTLGLAGVGTCTGTPAHPGTCTAAVTGIQAAQGGTQTVWLIGQGLDNISNLSVTVSHGASTDVPVTRLTQGAAYNGVPTVYFQIQVSASATEGARNIVVTNTNNELAVFVGAIQIVP